MVDGRVGVDPIMRGVGDIDAARLMLITRTSLAHRIDADR